MSRKSRLNVSVNVYHPWLCSGLGECLFGNHSAIRMSGSTFQPLQCLGNVTSAPGPTRYTLSFNRIPPKISHLCEASVINTLLFGGPACTCWRAPVQHRGATEPAYGWMDHSSWFSRNCFDIKVLQLRDSSLNECRHPLPLKSSTKMDCRSILHRSSEQMGDPTTPNCEHLRERSQTRIANWEGKESCTSSKEIPEIWKGGALLLFIGNLWEYLELQLLILRVVVHSDSDSG